MEKLKTIVSNQPRVGVEAFQHPQILKAMVSQQQFFPHIQLQRHVLNAITRAYLIDKNIFPCKRVRKAMEFA